MTNVDFFYNDIWSKTLSKVSESGQISEEEFDLYIDGTRLTSITEEGAEVSVPTFISYTLMNKNIELIERCLEEQIGKFVPISIKQKDDSISLEFPVLNVEYFDKTIDPNQNFSNFVTGKSNIQAQYACKTCANNLGMIYNPLFIYGDSGLGKTHLLNALGNEVRKVFPTKKIGFISGQGFIDALSKSKKEDRIDEFKSSFNELDLLLVDDVQFLANKVWTQEIFFSIFNTLVNNRKQICITADRTPNDIKGLEDRIISRFNQGLNVNIESPEYETTIRILKLKIANNVSVTEKVDDDVLSFIATNFSQNVRSLEGAVNRLLFYFINFNFDNEDHITLKLATEAFKNQITENKNEITIAKVRKTICDYYNITKDQIISSNRTKKIAIARHIAMYLCRKLIDAPYKEIGKEFGGRDHSTVINACEKVESLIKTDSTYLKAINEIEKLLN